MTEHIARLLNATSRASLGESPTWDERTQSLYWVDIERGELHRCRADGSDEATVQVGRRVGCIALRREAPGFIAGVERTIAHLTLDPLAIHPVVPIEADVPGNRCNDGKCDAAGRFWVGTCDEAMKSPTGWFYRLSGSGELTRTVGPLVCTNGPAFSPDGHSIYCVDSYGRRVHRYALAPSGELSDPRVFRSFEAEGWGYPDGLTCDVEGCVWIAHWGAARVSRFSPEGELVDVIRLPVTQPTSCTFGGAELRRLFITTAATGLDATANANGLAGAVFAVDLDVGGAPAARYAG
jgi:D-xylonolactonase